MTRVCITCGWFVLDGERCKRDGSLAVPYRQAMRTCGVGNLMQLQNMSAERRVMAFRQRRERLRARGAGAGHGR